MKYGNSSDEINAIGFVKGEDGQITIYMASKRKDDDTNIIMYYIPKRCFDRKEYLDEICGNAIGLSYNQVIEEIKKHKGNGNVIIGLNKIKKFEKVSFKY